MIHELIQSQRYRRGYLLAVKRDLESQQTGHPANKRFDKNWKPVPPELLAGPMIPQNKNPK